MTKTSIPAAGIVFLRALTANNDRDWFKANKARFDADLRRPAGLFAETLAEELSAQTKTPMEAKLFRIHRDIRFAKDKTPYNTHMRFAFWPSEATLKKPMSGPAFYLSVEPEEVIAGAGTISFEPGALSRYRNRVMDGEANKLSRLLTNLKNNGLRLDPPELKRLPHGFSATSPATETLLRRKGLAAWYSRAVPTPPADVTVDQCMDGLLAAKPVFDWLQAEPVPSEQKRL